jgi:copper transport protein
VSRLRRGSALAAIGLACAFGLPAAASAHARLVRAVPAAGVVLRRQPDRVAFTFNEPVEASFGVIRVYGPSGQEVEAGSPVRPPGESDTLEVPLRPNLPDGTYSATYRIVSADSFPVSGGVVFSIGAPSGKPSVPLPSVGGTGTATDAVFWLDRMLGYAAIGIVVGALCFLAFAWRPAAAAPYRGNEESWVAASAAFRRRTLLLVGTAIAVGVLASLFALPLQGASAAGTSIWGGMRAVGEIAHTRFGSLMIVRASAWLLLAAILVAAAAAGRRRPAHGRAVSLELVALVTLPVASLLVSPALGGHARTQSPAGVLFPADVVHVASMSVWLGGLVMLVAAVPAPAAELALPERRRLVRETVSRFSLVALVAAVALAASGIVEAMLEIRHVSDLVATGYGRAVLAKALLLGALVALGAVNRRRLVPALGYAIPSDEEPEGLWGALRRNVKVEVALVAAALAVTALLVSFAPPADTGGTTAAASQGRVSGRTTIGDTTLRYTVDPARAGLNQLNLYLFDSRGRLYRNVGTIRVDASPPGENTASQPLQLEQVGAGHYVDSAAEFDDAGRWHLKVTTTGTSRRPYDVAELQVAIG